MADWMNSINLRIKKLEYNTIRYSNPNSHDLSAEVYIINQPPGVYSAIDNYQTHL